ncbi:glycosyltransferase family 2 protein [Flavobacterium sp. NRK F10]|uniref:glycosyltransferase family 2 protein n=1 Tax=Flavobacterium sp. NRK F10 TaxID=2954931 RepID=UPI0020908EE9|nr:glycosyltransferase [Flavobacterium sp. NRK F10]MCO6176116.1 glycosyltransferase family 2 protein [Flavobacterium sp. NRK F10]
MNKIAIVILNWNGGELLRTFLPSIIQYSPQATLYVADNASTDNSIAIVQQEFPTVKIIQNKANYGFAKGYNEALKFVEEPIWALVNSDVEVTENWLTPIAELFESDENIAIVQPKILDFKNKSAFEYAGAAGGFLDKYGFPFCRGRVFTSVEKDNGQFDDISDIFWASGACFFIRKQVFWEKNGFDEDFFAHQEEIDLCWRVNSKGYSIKYCGYSKVYHVGGATLQVENPKKTFLNFRNSLWMLTKNLPKEKLFIILFSRLVLDGLAGVRFFFQGHFSHVWAILKAHFYFYKNLRKNLRKRKKSNLKHYYKINSVIYSYFIKGKKTFAELF